MVAIAAILVVLSGGASGDADRSVALEAFAHGDVATAEAILRELISADPADFATALALGYIILETSEDCDRLAEAAALLQDVVDRLPESRERVGARILLAEAWDALGRHPEAAEVRALLLQDHPEVDTVARIEKTFLTGRFLRVRLPAATRNAVMQALGTERLEGYAKRLKARH